MNQPIEKKDYSAGLRRPTKKKEFELLWERYFKWNRCSTYYPIKNRFSRCDYFLTSGLTTGDCSLVIEYKNRETVGVADYPTCFIEREKLERNLLLTEIVDSHFMYVVDYKDAVVCWKIEADHNLKADTVMCPVENGSVELVAKPLYHLQFKDAELVIAKKKYSRASVDQLLRYIKLIRKDVYGEED
ncbi:MAG: hypothetical protein OJF59_002505 [Cytophagales bacterium]|jgi:hypothetical protein|nr:hypothetical protein [Bacteroidota bacterium]MBS1980230.1 hypothetical protein [Bacteroidota bacterium]WHZ08751.1 MAG: hypothetical protein OJF59_002505 [Cytophagales bacterium]